MKIVSVGRNFGVKSKTRIQKMRQLRGKGKVACWCGFVCVSFLCFVLLR